MMMPPKSCLLIVLAALSLSAAAWGQEKFVLNMYHFNFQYVAGNERAAKEGVKKGFEPLLDLYLAHPDWKADFEMQASYLIFLDEHFPAVLEKLRRLSQNGQAELVSFHYADELILAFPARDRERSLQLTRETFARFGLPLSGVIFTQEAQFGEGVCALGKNNGYQTAVITPASYDWFQDDAGYPYFTCRGLEVIKAEDPDLAPEQMAEYVEPASGVRAKWYFLGDGELQVTGGVSPYFGPLFRPKKKIIAKMVADFERYQRDGYRIATVGEYMEALHRHEVQPRPMRPFLDSAWRPQDDQGMFTWMGKYSFKYEDDYGIRTGNWRARAGLVSAEQAGLSWDQLRNAWASQLEAEVSDSTGWYPLPVELRYSRSRTAAVIAEVKRLCPGCAPYQPDFVLVPVSASAIPVIPRIEGAGRTKLQYYSASGRDGLHAIGVSFVAGRDARVVFPISGPDLAYSPAMLESELVKFPFASIKPVLHYVGLPNGLIGLGDGRWLIRDNRSGTVAAGIDLGNHEVHFRVRGAGGRSFSFLFFLFQGPAADALALANQLNQTGD
jgi:hypothetical protein